MGLMDNETLVKLIKEGKDIKSNMERLYVQNKGLLYKIVKRYRNIDRMTDIDDLMQQAYIGLVEAVEHYDPDKGALFMTYAPYWIRQNIKRYLESTGRIIALPVHTQEKIYRYQKVTGAYLSQYNREPTDREYCYWMDCTQKQLESIRRTMRISAPCSLESPVGEDLTVGDISSNIENTEDAIDRERLTVSLWDAVKDAIEDSTDFQIIEDRYKRRMTMSECGKKHGLTAEKARQRQDKSMRKLRNNRTIKQIGEDENIFQPVRYTRNRKDYSRHTDWFADLTDEELLQMGAVL
ncbi:MAG TPA: sigma-70 family RNA polymerase sigma factor [Candidatus Fimousia stercorigallinarum]|nr:sigma-70 family RNA polymerase sigma factor [Candidatus Fimousia stercorigallinarum]